MLKNAETYPLKAIRSFCLQCVAKAREVELCVSPKCPLWPYRFGIRPDTARAKGKTVDRRKFVRVDD